VVPSIVVEMPARDARDEIAAACHPDPCRVGVVALHVTQQHDADGDLLPSVLSTRPAACDDSVTLISAILANDARHHGE
jgi:hypothetical protein